MVKQLQNALIILRIKQVQDETGLSRSSIYRGIQAGTFPSPISLGLRAVGWRRGCIDIWLADPASYRAQKVK